MARENESLLFGRHRSISDACLSATTAHASSMTRVAPRNAVVQEEEEQEEEEQEERKKGAGLVMRQGRMSDKEL